MNFKIIMLSERSPIKKKVLVVESIYRKCSKKMQTNVCNRKWLRGYVVGAGFKGKDDKGA